VRLATLVLCLLISAHCQAYCLTRTCNPTRTNCEFDNGCNVSGKQLYWASSCVSFDLQKDGSKLRSISYDDTYAVLVRAFQQWTNTGCGGGTTPKITIKIISGPIDCTKPEINKTQGNANVVTYHDANWPYVNGTDTLGADHGEFRWRHRRDLRC